VSDIQRQLTKLDSPEVWADAMIYQRPHLADEREALVAWLRCYAEAHRD
jgi:hypothetical protein